MKKIAIALAASIASFAPAAAHSPAETPEQAKIEAALVALVTFEGEEADRKTLEQRRQELSVRAASTAVFRNGEIAWARAYGEDVDEETLFQFASLSKPVAAAGIIALAFEQGVALDEDISGQLTGLDLERLNPDGLPITIAGLLSHTNGATVSGFPGYPSDGPIPGTREVIEGSEDTNTDAVVIKPNPTGERRYSGGGYTIAQYWAEQVSGESFEAVIRRLVLDPLGMKRSTFASSPPADFGRDNVADGWSYAGDMLEGKWRVHPEQAAASLWSTPSEYGLFVTALMKAKAGDERGAISPQVAQAMTTPVASSYGLGIGVADINGAIRLNHSGSNVGYKSNFMAYPASGDAIITVTNSDRGFALVGDIGRTANLIYRWPSSGILMRKRLETTARDEARYSGNYVVEGNTEAVFVLARDGAEFTGSTPSGYTFTLVKTGEATFIDPQDGQEGTFIQDEQGGISITFDDTTYVRIGPRD